MLDIAAAYLCVVILIFLDDFTLASTHMLLVNGTDELVVDIYLLGFDTGRADLFFVYHDLLGQLIEDIGYYSSFLLLLRGLLKQN